MRIALALAPHSAEDGRPAGQGLAAHRALARLAKVHAEPAVTALNRQ